MCVQQRPEPNYRVALGSEYCWQPTPTCFLCCGSRMRFGSSGSGLNVCSPSLNRSKATTYKNNTEVPPILLGMDSLQHDQFDLPRNAKLKPEKPSNLNPNPETKRAQIDRPAPHQCAAHCRARRLPAVEPLARPLLNAEKPAPLIGIRQTNPASTHQHKTPDSLSFLVCSL